MMRARLQRTAKKRNAHAPFSVTPRSARSAPASGMRPLAPRPTPSDHTRRAMATPRSASGRSPMLNSRRSPTGNVQSAYFSGATNADLYSTPPERAALSRETLRSSSNRHDVAPLRDDPRLAKGQPAEEERGRTAARPSSALSKARFRVQILFGLGYLCVAAAVIFAVAASPRRSALGTGQLQAATALACIGPVGVALKRIFGAFGRFSFVLESIAWTSIATSLIAVLIAEQYLLVPWVIAAAHYLAFDPAGLPTLSLTLTASMYLLIVSVMTSSVDASSALMAGLGFILAGFVPVCGASPGPPPEAFDRNNDDDDVANGSTRQTYPPRPMPRPLSLSVLSVNRSPAGPSPAGPASPRFVGVPPDEANDRRTREIIATVQRTFFSEKSPEFVQRIHSLRMSLSHLTIHELVGAGSVGDVYRASWRGETVAVKRIAPRLIQAEVVAGILREITVGSQCAHPNVLSLIGWTEEPYLCLVTPFMSRGTLRDFLTSPTCSTPSGSAAGLMRGLGGEHSAEDSPPEDGTSPRGGEAGPVWVNVQPGEWCATKARIAVDAASGLAHLHSRGLAHGDVKSGNLLVDATAAADGAARVACRVADLGSCRLLDPRASRATSSKRLVAQASSVRNLLESQQQREAQESQGVVDPPAGSSAYWIAPELARGEAPEEEEEEEEEGRAKRYSRTDKSDVWAFGVVLVEMITHRLPYHDMETNKSCFNQIRVAHGLLHPVRDVVPRPAREGSLAAVWELAQRCCAYDPKDRPSMQDVLFELFKALVLEESLCDEKAKVELTHAVQLVPGAPPPLPLRRPSSLRSDAAGLQTPTRNLDALAHDAKPVELPVHSNALNTNWRFSDPTSEKKRRKIRPSFESGLR